MKVNFNTIFYCIGGLALFLTFGYILSWLIAPGSYPRAEIYKFEIPEDSLISIIEKVKKEHPEINMTKQVKIPGGKSFFLNEGRRKDKDHWYSIYFYDSDKNEIIKTWTRPDSKTSTKLGLVSINRGLTLGNWRTINESFWWWKNEPDKKRFEERILNKIIEKNNRLRN